MNIVVIVEGLRVKEVIVPDSSVKVVVLDLDDPCGSETVTVEGKDVAVDAAASVRQTTDAARMNAILQELGAGLDTLEETDEVRAVRSLIQKGWPRT